MQIPFFLCCEIRQTEPELPQNLVSIQNLQRDRLTTLARSTSCAENFELEDVAQLEVSWTARATQYYTLSLLYYAHISNFKVIQN